MRSLRSLLTAALALTAGAAVVSAAALILATAALWEVVGVLSELTARALEESP